MSESEIVLWELMSAQEQQSVLGKLRQQCDHMRESGQYGGARLRARMLAERGDVYGMYNYGVMLHQGQAGAQDLAGARAWYLKAAERNNAYAMINYGLMLHNGQGGTQDLAGARAWYLRAADLGIWEAKIAVSYYFSRGIGVEVNIEQSQNYLQGVHNDKLLEYAGRRSGGIKAYALSVLVDRGNIDGIMQLAQMYLDGNGVEKDPVKAKEILDKTDMKSVGDKKDECRALCVRANTEIQQLQPVEVKEEGGQAAKRSKLG